MLWNLRDGLDPAILREAIHDIWTQVNDGLIDLPGIPTVPGQMQQRLSPAEWRELFSSAGYISYEDPNAGSGNRCESPTTLYRYAEHGGEIGWSWTSDPDKASRFRLDFDAGRERDGCVWVVKDIDPSRLLAHFHDKPLSSTNTEDEYVFEPRPEEVIHHRNIRKCPDYLPTSPASDAEDTASVPVSSGLTDEERTAQNEYGREEAHALYGAFTSGSVTTETLASQLQPVWCGAAAPLAVLSKAEWRPMWEAVGYRYGTERIARPSSPLTLYRGADEKNREGWSWTTMPEVAKYFAGAYKDGVVWTATIPPERLLARIDKHPDEGEYVVRPEGLEMQVYTGS
ncbi:hypothetical protein ACQGAO_30625 [Rhodococcus sp. 1.20]